MDLLEREADLEALEDVLARAARGQGSVTLVSGEAGIGKTRLLQEFSRRHESDARILWGACDDLSTPRTFGPFRDIANRVGGAMRSAFASGGSRAGILDATIEETLGRRDRPTMLVVEDAHWADGATLDMLKFLGRRIGESPTLLLITFREEEVSSDHPLRLVVGDLPPDVVSRITPAPLTRRAVAGLARHHPAQIDDLMAATLGNPFLVTEIVAAPPGTVPANVADAVRTRAARLSAPARDLAELASVVPGQLERWLLDAIQAVDAAALEECRERRLLEFDHTALWYRHELVRAAVQSALPPARRRHLNAEVLRALAEGGGDLARIVHHAHQAGDAAAVAVHAPAAARQASLAASHREALAHYRLADRHIDLMPEEEQANVLREYAIECYFTNEAAEGLTVAERALDCFRALGATVHEGEMLRWLSRLHWWLGDGERAQAIGLAAVDVLERVEPGPHLAMAYSNLAQISMLAQRFEITEKWATKAIEVARVLDDHDTLVHALNNLGSSQVRIGDMTGLSLLEESLRLSLLHGLDDHAGRAYANLIWTALDYRDYTTARRHLDDGLAFAEKRELGGSVYYMTAERARLRFDCGDWPGAEQDAHWVLGRPEEVGITRMPALALLARLQVRRGDPAADATLAEAWAMAEPTGELQRTAPVLAGRAERAWLRGDIEGTRDAVAAALRQAEAARQPWVIDELAFWHWRGGGEAPLQADSTTPFALQIRGRWQAAADAWAEIGCPYEQALALGDGMTSEPLLAALEIFDRLGAVPAAAIVRRKLRDLGVARVPRGPRPSTRARPGGLTARQFEVLKLMAEDLTNGEIADRLFVSPKTVDHHVSAVLLKLDASSRREAAVIARERGIL